MKKNSMLKVTKKLLEYHYNDDIKYEEGDKLDKHKAEFPDMELTTELNCICEYLPTKLSPKLIYKETKFNKGGLSPYKSYVEYIPLTLTKEILDEFSGHIAINYNNNTDKDVAERLSQDTYDGLAFYGTTGTLALPQSMEKYIKDYGKLDCICAVYNYNLSPIKYPCFKNCKENIKIPDLNFKYIPETIKYAVLEEEEYGTLQGNKGKYTYLFKNLPLEYYSKYIHIDSRTLAYSVEDDYFIGHSNSNQTKLNHLCYDVACNGLKKPIQLKLLEDGSSILYFSNKRQLMAQYLGVPSIPAIIILDNNKIPDYLCCYKPNFDCRDLANRLFNPYFLF